MSYQEKLEALPEVERDIMDHVIQQSRFSWFPIGVDQIELEQAVKALIKKGFLKDTGDGVRIPTIDDVDQLNDK